MFQQQATQIVLLALKGLTLLLEQEVAVQMATFVKIMNKILKTFLTLILTCEVLLPALGHTQATTLLTPCPQTDIFKPLSYQGSGLCSGNLQLTIPLFLAGIGEIDLEYNSIYAGNRTSSKANPLGTAIWQITGLGREFTLRDDTPYLNVSAPGGATYKFAKLTGIHTIWRSTEREFNAIITDVDTDTKEMRYGNGNKITYTKFNNNGSPLYYPSLVSWNGEVTNITYLPLSSAHAGYRRIDQIRNSKSTAKFKYTGTYFNLSEIEVSVNANSDLNYKYNFTYTSNKLTQVTGENTDKKKISYKIGYRNSLVSSFETPYQPCNLQYRSFYYSENASVQGILINEYAAVENPTQFVVPLKVYHSNEDSILDEYYKGRVSSASSSSFPYTISDTKSYSIEYSANKIVYNGLKRYEEHFTDGKLSKIVNGDYEIDIARIDAPNGAVGNSELIGQVNTFIKKSNSRVQIGKDEYGYTGQKNPFDGLENPLFYYNLTSVKSYNPTLSDGFLLDKFSYNTIRYSYYGFPEFTGNAINSTNSYVNSSVLAVSNIGDIQNIESTLPGGLKKKIEFTRNTDGKPLSLNRSINGNLVSGITYNSNNQIQTYQDYLTGESVQLGGNVIQKTITSNYRGKIEAEFDGLDNLVSIKDGLVNATRTLTPDFYGMYSKSINVIGPGFGFTKEYKLPFDKEGKECAKPLDLSDLKITSAKPKPIIN